MNIPKWSSVTDNTIVKWKMINKNKSNDLQNTTQKTKAWATRTIPCLFYQCKSILDIYFTEFGTTLITILPILYQYCYNAQITLRGVKYLHIIKYLLLHNFRENKPKGQSIMDNSERHWLHSKHKTRDGADKQHKKVKRWGTGNWLPKVACPRAIR
jgi:hypothetical protein